MSYLMDETPGDMSWWHTLSGKTVQIDPSTDRQTKKGLADPPPRLGYGMYVV
jgi:hypothetical protein